MTDPTTAALTAWLAEHAPGTDHDRRIIDADLLPGGDPIDSDPEGRNADRAAAAAWWAQVEPDQGRWAT